MLDESKAEHVMQWRQVAAERLAAQLSLREVVVEQIVVEFQFLLQDAPAPELANLLYEAVLERAGSASAGAASSSGVPWRQAVAQSRHEWVEIVIESVGGRLVSAYGDYLRRHWTQRSSELDGAQRYMALLHDALLEHQQGLQALLEQGHACTVLQQQLDAYQQAWAKNGPLPLLAGG